MFNTRVDVSIKIYPDITPNTLCDDVICLNSIADIMFCYVIIVIFILFSCLQMVNIRNRWGHGSHTALSNSPDISSRTV